MRGQVVAFSTVLIMLLGAAPATRPNLPSDRLVHRDFMKLKQSLEKGNGAESAALTSKATLDQYDKARKLAIDSTGVDFASLPQLQVLLIFQFRYLADRSMLTEMTDGAGAFAWGVEKGLVKKEALAGLSLRHVTVEGDQAFALLNKDGKPVDDLVLYFVKKPDDRWALRLEKVVATLEASLAEVREQSKKTKVELALYLLEKTYGQSMPEILEGPIK